jgi:hypothetical protein
MAMLATKEMEDGLNVLHFNGSNGERKRQDENAVIAVSPAKRPRL